MSVVRMVINAPDVDSFVRSAGQLADDMRKGLEKRLARKTLNRVKDNGMNWIFADYKFTRHVANIEIPAIFFQKYLLHDQLRVFKEYQRDPAVLHTLFTSLLSVADYGKYKYADIWGLYYQWSRNCWCVAICHPDLPEAKDGCELTAINLNISEMEIAEFQRRIAEIIK